MTGTRRPADLVDGYLGLVTDLVQVPVAAADPAVHIVGGRVADLAAYGIDVTADVNGSGAGMTLDAATSAAVGESFERYACCLPPPGGLIAGSYAEVRHRGDAEPVEPDRWALFDPTQEGKVPFPVFDERTPVTWARGWSLTRQRARLVPACLVYFGPDADLCPAGCVPIAPAVSTGAACDATAGGATLRGLLELIERDAVLIHWRNRITARRIRIDPASPFAADFAEVFARPGLDYALYDVSLDLPGTAVFGTLTDHRRSPAAVFAGGAAHPDPHAAVRKTLLELVQGLRWGDQSAGTRVDLLPGFVNIRSFEDRMHLYSGHDMRSALEFLDDGLERDGGQPRPAVDLSTLDASRDRAADPLGRLVDELARRDLEVIAVDVTTADLAECGIVVVKTLVPGLTTMEGDHTAPFLGGRRWRRLPVELGLLARERTDDELNPYPHPYP